MKFRKPASIILVLALTLPFIIAACGESVPENLTFELQIKDQTLVNSEGLLKATQDDIVSIVVNSDEHVSFHLHGYDIEEIVEPGEPATLRFTANATGSFPFTIHLVEADHDDDEEDDVELGRLEIQPR